MPLTHVHLIDAYFLYFKKSVFRYFYAVSQKILRLSNVTIVLNLP